MRGHRFTGVRDQFFARRASSTSRALVKLLREGQIGARQAIAIGAGRAPMNEQTSLADCKLRDACETMAEVRAGVDATDRELMALLDRRFGYMRAAARIKDSRDTVRDEARKGEVIGNAREDAEARALPGDAIADIWERLVEASIAYELVEWDRLRS